MSNDDDVKEDVYDSDTDEVVSIEQSSDFLKGYFIPNNTSISFMTTPVATGRISLPEDVVIEVNIVVDSTVVSDGYAQFDPEKMLFTITVPPHVEIVQVNTTAVATHYQVRNTTIFSDIAHYPDIFSIRVDDTQKPSCKWYSPAAWEISNGAVQVDNYPYNRARKNPSCSNPLVSGDRRKYVDCRFSQHFQDCNYSEMSTWEDIRVAYNNDAVVLSIRRSFFANKMPYYQLYDHAAGITVVDKTDDLKMIKDRFDAECASASLFVNDTKSERRSYFKAVLT